MVWLDLDDSVIQTSGYAKQAAGRGYTGVKGLNALRHRLHPLGGAGGRRNAATSGERPLVRGAATLVTEALQVARRCGACGPVILRTDSAFYTRAVVTAAHEAGARFSVTTPLYPSVTRAVRRHRRHPDSLAPIAYATSIRDTPRQKALLAAATGSNGDQLRVPLTKFEVRCATHLVHRRNVPRPQ
jgi:hypothetical protein